MLCVHKDWHNNNDMNSITKQLAKRAKEHGICKPWYYELKTLEDKEALIEMYIRGLDFCLEHNYPSNDFIRQHFKGIMEKHGVFLDDAIELQNPSRCIALGETNGKVEADEYAVVEVWAKHQAALNIIAKGNAFVMVDVYDDAVVNVCAYDRAKVCVNKHGGKVTYNATDDAVVKFRDKSNK